MPNERQMIIVTGYPLPSISPKNKCMYFLHFNNLNTKTPLKLPSLLTRSEITLMERRVSLNQDNTNFL